MAFPMAFPTKSISLTGKLAACALAASMFVAVSAQSPAQAASEGLSRAPVAITGASAALTDVSARAAKRSRPARRAHRRNDAAAAAIFGMAAGAIGSAIAESRRRDYYRDNYYYGGDPYYGRPYYGGPGYYGGYRYYPY